jgi:hypothetical protein
LVQFLRTVCPLSFKKESRSETQSLIFNGPHYPKRLLLRVLAAGERDDRYGERSDDVDAGSRGQQKHKEAFRSFLKGVIVLGRGIVVGRKESYVEEKIGPSSESKEHRKNRSS